MRKSAYSSPSDQSCPRRRSAPLEVPLDHPCGNPLERPCGQPWALSWHYYCCCSCPGPYYCSRQIQPSLAWFRRRMKNLEIYQYASSQQKQILQYLSVSWSELMGSLKLGNVWVIVQQIFIGKQGPKISCTKTQTLPNLRLQISSRHNKKISYCHQKGTRKVCPTRGNWWAPIGSPVIHSISLQRSGRGRRVLPRWSHLHPRHR